MVNQQVITYCTAAIQVIQGKIELNSYSIVLVLSNAHKQ